MLLVVASVVVVIAGLKAAASLLLPFLISLFIALITLPLLNFLRSSVRCPTPLAVAATVVVALTVLAAMIVLIGGSIKDLTDEAPKYRTRIEAMFDQSLAWLEARGFEVEATSTAQLVNPARAVDVATGTLRGIANVLSNFLLVLLTIVFVLLEAAGFPDKLQRAFGDASGSARYEKIRDEVQRYLAIKSLVSLATGSLVAVGLAVIGVDFHLFWGLLAFLLNYVPTLGSIIAGGPPVVLALLQLGPAHAIATALLFLSINLVLGNFVEPHLMGRRLGLSTLVVFLSLVFWGWVWGPIGMLLSVPLTMLVKISLENTEDLRWLAVLLGPADPRSQAADADG